MKIYQLFISGHLDPFWFNRLRNGRHSSTVSADSTVNVEGGTLHLRGDRPLTGTSVQVWLNSAGFFVCATDEEIEQDAEDRRAKMAAKDAQKRALLDTCRDEACAFNAKITLPVQWCVGIKDVLSGLSERSWGNGRNKATVEHIYLLQDFKTGRLKRSKGDFLCTSASGSNGKRWSVTTVLAHDGAGKPYQPKVTCKACLKLTGR